jgi:aryl-alcohol dehydrogenase
MKITAAVVPARSAPFQIDTLDLTDPRPDELLVEVVASGLCATDLHGRDGYYDMPFPAVFGHEGAGIVRAAGSNVKEFKAGDPVLMAYPWCGECPNCRAERQTYCVNAGRLKHGGTRADGSTMHSKDGKPVYSAFFQQSSFGNYTIANERFAVKLQNDVPLEVVCALACGGQTGAGAVLNVMKPKPGESLVVFGVGTVGLASLMAGKLVGCDPIIAVDVHEHRLKLAREVGATLTVNHRSNADIVAEIRTITGLGARYSVETSAIASVFREAVDCLMPAGVCVLLGSARSGTEVAFDMPVLQNGREVRGVIQGDSLPKQFIPLLADHIAKGRFPIEKLITYYDLGQINQGAADSASGKAIKPVLRLPH